MPKHTEKSRKRAKKSTPLKKKKAPYRKVAKSGY